MHRQFIIALTAVAIAVSGCGNAPKEAAPAKKAVADALPYYCTPKYVLALDELPMTSRGKIDKRKLLQLAPLSPARVEALREEAEEMQLEIVGLA